MIFYNIIGSYKIFSAYIQDKTYDLTKHRVSRVILYSMIVQVSMEFLASVRHMQRKYTANISSVIIAKVYHYKEDCFSLWNILSSLKTIY